MSEAPRQSRPFMWVLVLTLAILMYATTWPFVELHFQNSLHMHPGMARVRVDGPTWLVWLYTPMNLLRDANAGCNPFGSYWDWCDERVKARRIEQRERYLRSLNPGAPP